MTENPDICNSGNSPPPELHIDVTRSGDRIKISAFEQFPGEVSTVRHYDDVPVSMNRINARCSEIVRMLNTAGRRGRVTADVLSKLKEIGQTFTDDLFPAHVKAVLARTQADHLIIHLDDRMVQVPWELLHDGNAFLCQRFGMGRLVRTRQNVPSGNGRKLTAPLKMLILADPAGDLKGAYAEGVELRDHMDQRQGPFEAALCADNISAEFTREKLRRFDLVHFAGHCDYDPSDAAGSGWRLTDGHLKAAEIMKMAGTGTMPAFIFSNACQSARTEAWAIRDHFHDEIFGLANAFVLSGVKHYVGTFWEIPDEPGRRFALEFYRFLVDGESVGRAMRNARNVLIEEYGEETIIWASYLLYGDPGFNYMARIQAGTPRSDTAPVRSGKAGNEVRGGGPEEIAGNIPEEIIDFGENARASEKPGCFPKKTALFLLAMLILPWIWPDFVRNRTGEYEKTVLSHYRAGKYEKALAACDTLADENPEARLAWLVRGDIYLRNGKPDAAWDAYQKAIAATRGTDAQAAQVYMGLGRIASLRGQIDAALEYYRQASDMDPASGAGDLSQALLLAESGDSRNALGLLEKALAQTPENAALDPLVKQLRGQVASGEDLEKQARIDQMIKELLENRDREPPPSEARWTSSPLTVWVMDFETLGYAVREGDRLLLNAGLTDFLVENRRAQVVEREILEKLLTELKLGASRLADRETALSLGKVMAARLILTGRIIYSGPETQVSMRLIETETGRIAGSVSEIFGSAVPAPAMAEKLSEKLGEILRREYPLRGEITAVDKNQVRIGIGEKIGVVKGQRFRVIGQGANTQVEIADVDSEFCVAPVPENTELTAGLRVEEIERGAP